VTIFGRVNHLDTEPGTQAYSAWAGPLCRLEWVPGRSWESKHSYRVTHQPVSVVLHVHWLPGWMSWLAEISTNLREVVVAHWRRRCAIQKAAFT